MRESLVTMCKVRPINGIGSVNGPPGPEDRGGSGDFRGEDTEVHSFIWAQAKKRDFWLFN